MKITYDRPRNKKRELRNYVTVTA